MGESRIVGRALLACVVAGTLTACQRGTGDTPAGSGEQEPAATSEGDGQPEWSFVTAALPGPGGDGSACEYDENPIVDLDLCEWAYVSDAVIVGQVLTIGPSFRPYIRQEGSNQTLVSDVPCDGFTSWAALHIELQVLDIPYGHVKGATVDVYVGGQQLWDWLPTPVHSGTEDDYTFKWLWKKPGEPDPLAPGSTILVSIRENRQFGFWTLHGDPVRTFTADGTVVGPEGMALRCPQWTVSALPGMSYEALAEALGTCDPSDPSVATEAAQAARKGHDWPPAYAFAALCDANTDPPECNKLAGCPEGWFCRLDRGYCVPEDTTP